MLQTARNLWRKNYQGIMAVVFADGKEAVVFSLRARDVISKAQGWWSILQTPGEHFS